MDLYEEELGGNSVQVCDTTREEIEELLNDLERGVGLVLLGVEGVDLSEEGLGSGLQR